MRNYNCPDEIKLEFAHKRAHYTVVVSTSMFEGDRFARFFAGTILAYSQTFLLTVDVTNRQVVKVEEIFENSNDVFKVAVAKIISKKPWY